MNLDKPIQDTRTRIKFCGITRHEDAIIAARLGVDAIGLVFYSASSRAVDVMQARDIIACLPPFVTIVGLFVNPEVDDVKPILDEVALDLLQFHGDESPQLCARFGLPYIKAIRMQAGVDVHRLAKRHHDAKGLLLDSYHAGAHGGTGKVFDWSRVPDDLSLPVIIAGGLSSENVADAITNVHPYGVDVSGGIESAKGVKDGDKMINFIRSVMRAQT